MLRNSIRGAILGSIIGYAISWGAFAPKVQAYALAKMQPTLVVEKLQVQPLVTLTGYSVVPKPRVRKWFSQRERECLAKNVFFEAGVEPLIGKIAVAQVTLNRLMSNRWGKSICEVVYKKAQFSWTLVQNKRTETPKGVLWQQAQHAVKLVLDEGVYHTSVKNSLFYHTDYIKEPEWAHEKYRLAQVGQHIFYEKDLKK